MRKIAIYSGSRADYCPLSSVLKLLDNKADVKHIKTAGLFDHEAHIKFWLEEFKPDLVVLLGDRYESLVAASVAALLTIPIVHIHGGEETTGAVDNAFRHAITKLSYYHFAMHEDFAARIIKMGEHPERVFVTGAPGIDQYANEGLTREQLEKQLDFRLIPPFALVCYHPETLGSDDLNMQKIHQLMEEYLTVVVTGANQDIGGDAINRTWQADNANIYYRPTFSPEIWTSLMRHADVLIGNSSCFIIDGFTLGKKVIIIGDRQKGRYEDALRHFADNPKAYGEIGNVSLRIVELLLTLPIPEKPRKEWYDYTPN